MKKLFISYRQFSLEHAQSVQRLARILRQKRIPVEIDQLYLDERPGGPDEGWPSWCEFRANKCEAVLVIALQAWFAVYEGSEEPGIGCGAALEAALIKQCLYDERENRRVRFAFLHDMPKEQTNLRRLFKERTIRNLQRKARELGFHLTPGHSQRCGFLAERRDRADDFGRS